MCFYVEKCAEFKNIVQVCNLNSYTQMSNKNKYSLISNQYPMADHVSSEQLVVQIKLECSNFSFSQSTLGQTFHI